MSKTKPWFDPIAFAYAQHFDEVEVARSQFEHQRRVILDRLSGVTKKSLENAALKVLGDAVRDDGWDIWYIAGAWTKIRLDVGKKSDRQSGICVGLDRDPCFESNDGARFGFGAYAFFAMSQNRYTKLRAALSEAASSSGAVADYSPTDLTAYVRCSWIRPGDETFALEAFEEQVQRLPGLFAKFDLAVDTAYKRSKGDVTSAPSAPPASVP